MEPDLTVDAASETMSRNRFHLLKRFLHFSDNQNLSSDDEMSKVSPLYQMLNDRQGKPIHVGYKVWMLCGTDGYPYHLNIYQVKEPSTERAPVSE
ncbi:hypothetical protein T07_1744 [Trichinella nelsoni]|nr:hypothetical protein T07_1744 [Trichinella nelsoni]